jgi:DNA-binding transcriptional ArsR family regulator
MNPSKISLPEQVASLLARGEPMTAAQLCAATGKSQPSISLALQALGDQVCKMGAARSTSYAMVRDMVGLPATQELFWTEVSGKETRLGDITYLQGDRFFLKLGSHQTLTQANTLPWYLQPLKPQGFLGRQLLRSRADLPQNPELLSTVQILNLMAARRADPPGAITVGIKSASSDNFTSDTDAVARLTFLESLASAGSQSAPPKSSAGGEQPKFTLVWLSDSVKHELVKFSPPHGTPFGERWKALLKLEHLALNVLQNNHVETASTQCHLGEKRFFLCSQRFDRVAAHGKRHVVAISALHDEFTPGIRQNWVHTAQGLYAKKLISQQELSVIATIHAFGHYIGNTDMHFGNLSFFVDDVITPKIRLAPVYDMLPMMWRPEIHQGSLSDSPVRAQPMPAGFAQEQAQAREWAIEFWEQAAKLDVGADLQAASAESARRLKTNFAGV